MSDPFVLIYDPQLKPDDGDGDCGDCSNSSNCSDCACPDIARGCVVTDESADVENYQVSPDVSFVKLTDGFVAAANPASLPGIVVLSAEAHRYLLDSPANHAGSDPRRAELARVGLLSPSGPSGRLAKFMEAETTLTAWLHVSNACPLTCSYCYIAKSAERMELETGLTAVQTVFSQAARHGFQAVKLKYAGGEPTLNLHVVEAMHHAAQRHARESNIKLEEVLLTSGVMSSSGLQQVASLGTRVMVSLDALDAHHDRQRPLLNGKPTSLQAVRTLDSLLQAGVDVCVSVTMSSQPAKVVIELLDYLLDRGVPFSLNFARDNQHFNERDLFLPQHPALIETCISVIDHLCDRLPERSLAGALLDRASLTHPHHYACGVGHSYLVIDQKGQVAKCQQEIESSLSSIFEDDFLLKVFNSPMSVQNLNVDDRPGCQDCRWRYWCAGGCSALSQMAAQNPHQDPGLMGRSPYCDVYMEIFPHIVRLEGLRLLRYRPHQVVL